MKVRNIVLARISNLFRFCPQCNSDATAIDNCIVCESNRSSPFDKKTNDKIWSRYEGIRLLEKYKFPPNEWANEFKKSDEFMDKYFPSPPSIKEEKKG